MTSRLEMDVCHKQSQNNVIMGFSVLFYCEKHSLPALIPASLDCKESNTSRSSSWDPKYFRNKSFNIFIQQGTPRLCLVNSYVKSKIRWLPQRVPLFILVPNLCLSLLYKCILLGLDRKKCFAKEFPTSV